MKHIHHGKSSAKFLDSDEILMKLNFKGDETFMDAGCGDGHISIKAAKEYLPEGTVYAVDAFDEAINVLEEYKNENSLENLIAVEADITKTVPGIKDSSVDVVLMVNVIHGFKNSAEMDAVIGELKRLIKNGGKIAVIDFKPIEMEFGPPVDIRFSPDELKEIFAEAGFEMSFLDEDIGEDISEGKSHYMIIFEKV